MTYSETLARFAEALPEPADGERDPMGRDGNDVYAAATSESQVRHVDHLLQMLSKNSQRVTVLADALDESRDPLIIATSLLKPLSWHPLVKLVVGTRPSLYGGPDISEPVDGAVLAALGTPSDVLTLDRDPAAVGDYMHQRLLHTDGSPYADSPELVARLSVVVAAYQQPFLFARLATYELLRRPPVPAQGNLGLELGWLAGGHRGLFVAALDRFRREAPDTLRLLHALAFGLGRGLPRHDRVWATVAESLQPGRDISADTIDAALEQAACFITVDGEDGQTTFRLSHQTFVEHVRYESHDVPPDADRRITHALLNLGSQLGWDNVNPYVSRHLPEHASLGKVTDDLLRDQGALDHVDQRELRAIVVPAYLGHPAAPRTARSVIRSGHLLQTVPPSDRPAVRALVAATDGEQPGKPSEQARWWPRWARLAAGPPHVTLTGHPGGASSLATIPMLDGSTTLVTVGNGQLMLWNPLTTQPRRSEPIHDELSPGRSPTNVVTLSLTDGRTVLCVVASNAVWLWDISDESIPCLGAVQTGPYQPGGGGLRDFTVVRLSSGQLLLATCGTWDGTVRLWDVGTGTRYGQPLKGHKIAVMALIVVPTPEGDLLASFDYDGSARLWDPSSGTTIKRSRRLFGGEIKSRSVTLVPQSEAPPILATGDSNGNVQLWDPVTFKPTRTLSGHRRPIVAALPWPQRNGVKLLATTSDDGEVRLWDPVAGSSFGQFVTERKLTTAIAVQLPDGRALLATTSDDGAARLWDLSSNVDSKPGSPRSFAPVAAVPLPGGATLLATGSDDCTVRLWEATSGDSVGQLLTGHKWPKFAIPVPLSDNRTLLATADAVDDTVLLWDPVVKARVGAAFKGHTYGIEQIVAVTLLDGRTLLATLDGAGRMRVWNVSRPTRPSPLWYDGPPIRNRIMKFLTEPTPLMPDSRRIRSLISLPQPCGRIQFAVRNETGVTVLVDPATGEDKLLNYNNAGLMARTEVIAAVPIVDGRTVLATRYGNPAWHLWDPATGEPLGMATHDLALRVNAAVYLPDGRTLLADAWGDSVRLWSVAADGTKECVVSIQLIAPATIICTLPGPALTVGTDTGVMVFDLPSLK